MLLNYEIFKNSSSQYFNLISFAPLFNIFLYSETFLKINLITLKVYSFLIYFLISNTGLYVVCTLVTELQYG